MSSFFPSRESFSSWLTAKTESELKTMLLRADSRSRLNGSKSALVSRVMDMTRNHGREKELRVFPELRHRQREQHSVAGAARHPQRTGQHLHQQAVVGREGVRRSAVVLSMPNVESLNTTRSHALDHSRLTQHQTLGAIPRTRASAATVRTRPLAEGRDRTEGVVAPRGIAPPSRLQSRASFRLVTRHAASSTSYNPRPLPVFPPSRQDVSSPATTSPILTTTPLRTGFQNPRAFTSGLPVTRTPEQMLQESLEAHAGLLIQSITNSFTPRIRLNSLSNNTSAATAIPTRPRPRAASSAEKIGPVVSIDDEESYKNKLECKICFDATVNTVLLPCGHACCCRDCSVRLKFATWDSKCPICRARIQNISILFFS